MLFDRSSPPPFYHPELSVTQRQTLDQWFIGTRSQAYYLKRFAAFDQGQQLAPRWHWAAFWMTLPWMLYRGRFLDGLVYAVVGWSFLHLITTLLLVMLETALLPFVDASWHWPMRMGGVAVMALGWSLLTAMWADAYYYRVARREISDTLAQHHSKHEQQAHLQREGGTHWMGLILSFALFGFVLMTIQTLYLPMYATYVRRTIMLNAYDVTQEAQQRVAAIMQQQQSCPVGLALATQAQIDQLGPIRVLAQADGVPRDSGCVVQLTLTHAPWPVDTLKGEHLTLYQQANHWVCMTSIGRRESPQGCQLDD
jgi:hypothetical protein